MTEIRRSTIVSRLVAIAAFSMAPNGHRVAWGVSIDLSARSPSLQFYYQAYLPSNGIAIGWTGDHAACEAGVTSSAFQQAVIQRVNYFRAMAGVPATVVLNEQWNAAAQQAALMMSANTGLDHTPPSSWKCFTNAGAMAAGKSNLALGANGTAAVDLYMQDPGANNSAVGHRRLLLYPPTNEMGAGDVARMTPYLAANALWVKDDTPVSPRPATRNPYVAWPPPGFVPYQVTYARWSFSYAGANFANATVSMLENGLTIPTLQEPVAGGFGDNTFVWRVNGLSDSANWPHPSRETRYTVKIENVVISGSAHTFAYDTVVFDPAVLLADFNADLLVDAADLAIWRNYFGDVGAGALSDADGDGDNDGADFLEWQRETGLNISQPPSLPVPEPATVLLAVTGLIALSLRRRQPIG